ncbi:MAG: hypothetical protein IPM07_20555 [Anaerolineales bacterium]|nr:hypothetical protein [Anaerolineales bacterium]
MPTRPRLTICADKPAAISSCVTPPRTTLNDHETRWRPATSAIILRSNVAWMRKSRSIRACSRRRGLPVKEPISSPNGKPHRCSKLTSSTYSPRSSSFKADATSAAATNAAALWGDASSATRM